MKPIANPFVSPVPGRGSTSTPVTKSAPSAVPPVPMDAFDARRSNADASAPKARAGHQSGASPLAVRLGDVGLVVPAAARFAKLATAWREETAARVIHAEKANDAAALTREVVTLAPVDRLTDWVGLTDRAGDVLRRARSELHREALDEVAAIRSVPSKRDDLVRRSIDTSVYAAAASPARSELDALASGGVTPDLNVLLRTSQWVVAERASTPGDFLWVPTMTARVPEELPTKVVEQAFRVLDAIESTLRRYGLGDDVVSYDRGLPAGTDERIHFQLRVDTTSTDPTADRTHEAAFARTVGADAAQLDRVETTLRASRDAVLQAMASAV